MNAIDEIVVKLDRAKEHLDLLDKEIIQFLENEPYRFAHQFEHKGGLDYDLVSTLHIDREPPLRLSAIFGDGLHNVRSALDHLVYQLAVDNVGLNGDLDKTEFPIFTDKGQYFRVDKKGIPVRGSGLDKIRSIASGAQAIIESLQPYHGGDNIILRELQDLSNIDKHRHFHLVSVPLGNWQLGTPVGDRGIGPFTVEGIVIKSVQIAKPPFKDGTEVVRTHMIVPEGFDFKVRVYHEISGDVILNEFGLRNAFASDILAGTIGFVRRKVLVQLEPFLKIQEHY